MLKNSLISLAMLFCFSNGITQTKSISTFEVPLKLPLFLSGNFGELRSNHFHAGIDFKTQGTIGHPVYSCEEGSVSRIVISPWGYGKALYIAHPNGMTTLYAHLDTFSPFIEKAVKEYQYTHETFALDIHFEKGEIPVSRGQRIALSGNSGSSGGPHLHFEIRDTESQDVIDPLAFFIDRFKDTRKPEIRAIRVFPKEGVVNGSFSPISATIIKKEDGSSALDKKISAWGRIGLGIKAYDFMNETTNIYGVKQVRLYIDDQLHFAFQCNRISFSETRYLNSLIDYADWKNNRSMLMKLFTDPGNQLSIYSHSVNQGFIDINEERDYSIRFEVNDAHGNKSVLPMTIKGVRQKIPTALPTSDMTFLHNEENRMTTAFFHLNMPEGSLYEDIEFNYSTTPSDRWHSEIHTVHCPSTPIHKHSDMRIAITTDTLVDKSKYYLGRFNNQKVNYLHAKYEAGFMVTQIRDFDTFVVDVDQTAPIITPVQPENWSKNGLIKVKISDSQSGIGSWRGTIDNQFVVFEFDGKNALLTYKMDAERVGRNRNHQLKLCVFDNCGNEKQYKRSFMW